MTKAHFSKLFVAGLLLAAGASQAAPISVSEVPPAWYADRIVTPDTARGATSPVFPTAAYEHGITVQRYAETKTTPSHAGVSLPFPASPNESGRVL